MIIKTGIAFLFLIVIGWLALTFFSKRSEKAIYLLPDGYIGPVIVVLNQSAGMPEKYEGKSRVYEIPSTGVLYSKFGVNVGVQDEGDERFYYRRQDGARTPLPYLLNWTVGSIKDFNAAQMQVVTVRGSGFGSSVNKNNQEFVYESFVIGPLKDGETLFRQKIWLIDQAIERAEAKSKEEKQ